MKTEYYIYNKNYSLHAHLSPTLCKVVNNIFYKYNEKFEQWGEVPYYTRHYKNKFSVGHLFIKVTEEEAFRYMLEN